MAIVPFITVDEAMSLGEPNHEAPTTEQEAVYSALVSAICTSIEEYLHWPVVARELSAISDGACKSIFLLHQKDDTVLRISKIVEDGATLFEAAQNATDDSTLTSDYHACYKGPGYIVRKSGSGLSTWAAGVQSVVITYTSGLAKTANEVPEDLKLAAKIAFKFYRRMGDADFGKVVEGGSFITPDKFPRQCLWIMDKYRLAR